MFDVVFVSDPAAYEMSELGDILTWASTNGVWVFVHGVTSALTTLMTRGQDVTDGAAYVIIYIK